MGAWSTAITGNDTSADVSDYFKRMYNYQEGGVYKWTPEQITNSIITYYFDTMQSLPSEKCDVVFALAQSLRQVGELTTPLKKLVHKLVHEKIDYNAWKELDATEKSLKERWKVTTAFCETLEKPYVKVKKRKLQPARVSLYTSGDCLAFEYNGYYYGVVIANDGRNYNDGSNDLLLVNIRSRTLPVLRDFANSSPVLNEDLVNSFLNISSTGDANPPVVFTFKMTRASIKPLLQSAVLVGRLPLTRIFFESAGIRFTEYNAPFKSAQSLLNTAFAFWNQKKWEHAAYALRFECEAPFDKDMMLKNDVFVTGEKQFKLKDLYAGIKNSLWHIDLQIHIKGATAADIEHCWTAIAGMFAFYTGREINTISIVNSCTGLQPFHLIDFSTYKLKDVKDISII